MSTAAGTSALSDPRRVNDTRIDLKTVARQLFSSAILPAWVRQSPQISEVLPLLYLHGSSTSDLGAGAWCAVNVPHLVRLVRNGATFHQGILPETRSYHPARTGPNKRR